MDPFFILEFLHISKDCWRAHIHHTCLPFHVLGRHVRHRSSPDILLDRLSAAISESSTDLESVDPFSVVQDEAFPLRYVFYVEDNPKSLRIFGYGGRASQMAREINCRVEFQAHFPHTLGMFDHNPRSRDNPEPVELAFYHCGKRVRPVIVAAPNLNALLSFVKQLDRVFPEFEASRFLNDRLDKPKLGATMESNRATLIWTHSHIKMGEKDWQIVSARMMNSTANARTDSPTKWWICIQRTDQSSWFDKLNFSVYPYSNYCLRASCTYVSVCLFDCLLCMEWTIHLTDSVVSLTRVYSLVNVYKI